MQNLLSLQFLPELAITSLGSKRHGWLFIIYSRFFPLRMQLSSTQQLLQLHIYTPGEAIIFIAHGPWQFFFFLITEKHLIYINISLSHCIPKKKIIIIITSLHPIKKKIFFFLTQPVHVCKSVFFLNINITIRNSI